MEKQDLKLDKTLNSVKRAFWNADPPSCLPALRIESFLQFSTKTVLKFIELNTEMPGTFGCRVMIC